VSKLSLPAQLGMLGAGLLIVLVVGWFAVVAPKRSEASKLQEQIDTTHGQIVAARGAGAKQASTIRVADLFELSRAMPNQVDIPNVLLQLSDLAAETGVSFESISPHDPVPLTGYEQIGIDLVFEGHFYDLSDFLYRLRSLVSVHDGVLAATGRLFSVDSISFDQGDLLFPQVKATLTVSAYVFGDGTASPVPPAAIASDRGSATTTTTANEDSQPIPAAPAGGSAAGT
jgi:hypothetical protein